MTWQYERVKKAKRVLTEGVVYKNQILRDQGYSVDMAIQMKKPVFVKDEWGHWLTFVEGRFQLCDPPTKQKGDLWVPDSHMGIGSDHPFIRKKEDDFITRMETLTF